MGYNKHKYPWGGLTVILISVLLIFGCAGHKPVQEDSPFQKWNTMAETATGHSPTPLVKNADIARELLKSSGEIGEELTAAPIKELPTQPVTLKMRQADVKTVLRALARIVDRNIFVKNEIIADVTIDFRDVPWNQAFNSILSSQGLIYTWQGNIIRVMTMADAELDLKRKTQELEIRWVEPLLTIVIPINYAIEADTKSKDSNRGKVLKENLESFLTRSKDDKPRGSVRVDLHSNSLIISAIKEDLLKMLSIIEKIDKPMPQIQIQANIVETTKDTARNLGVQWGGMYNPRIGNHNLWVTPGGTGGSTTTNPTAGDYTPLYGATGISGQGFGANFPISETDMSVAGGAGSLGLLFGSIGGNILDIQLSALQKNGKLNILSSPSITTMDNQTAFTENGEKVPYVSINSDGNQEVKFQDAVLRLEITPHVIDGRSLSMKILVKKDEVDMSRTVQGNPFIIKKQTETSLIAQDGETIVISGLTKQRGTKTVNGIPWLKDIPVLGWLFKGEGKSELMEEVLIFITPKILPTTIAAAASAGGEQPAGTDAGEKPNAEKAPKP